MPANLGIKISNPTGAGAYPITSQTFIVVNKDLCKAGTPGGEAAAKGVVKFITYGLNEGQSILSQADYAGAAGVDPRQVQGGRGGPAVQRLADRRLSTTRRPRIG